MKEGASVALVFSIFRTLRWPSEPIEVLMGQFPFYQNQFPHIKAILVLIVIKLTILGIGRLEQNVHIVQAVEGKKNNIGKGTFRVLQYHWVKTM